MARGEMRLTRGGEVLAVLRPDGRRLVPELDTHVTVEAAYTTTPAFEPVRHLFERELQILDVETEPESGEWLDIWEELKGPGLFVESDDGPARFDILWIHFDHGRAWWWPLYRSPLTILPTRPPGAS